MQTSKPDKRNSHESWEFLSLWEEEFLVSDTLGVYVCRHHVGSYTCIPTADIPSTESRKC